LEANEVYEYKTKRNSAIIHYYSPKPIVNSLMVVQTRSEYRFNSFNSHAHNYHIIKMKRNKEKDENGIKG
jgi:hypothetical protein